jgi:hypothetical protein
MRNYKVYSSVQSGLVDRSDNVNTWGELKAVLKDAGIYKDDLEALIRETGSALVTDAATLPQNEGKDINGNVTHDFTLFLQPTKTKSGSNV